MRLTQPLLQRARLDIKPNGAMHHRYICMIVGTGVRKVDEKQNLRSRHFEIDCLEQLRREQPPQQGTEARRHSETATSLRLRQLTRLPENLALSSIVLDFEQLKH